MTQTTQPTLGQRLKPLWDGGFFRPLARPSAAVYVDCADQLSQAADEGGQIPFNEARLLIRETLTRHPDVQLEEDEGGQFRDLNQRAAQFFNKLLEARWFEPRRVSLDEHYVLVAPGLRHLLRTLHQLAEDRPAELKDFAATLRSLCRDLESEDSLDPNKLSAEEMRQTVKDLSERAGRAEDQMHAVEGLILQHETAQRSTDSPQETLQRFLVDFHAGEHMICYDALQEAGLAPRLNRAKSIVQQALQNPFSKQRLAEGLAKKHGLDSGAAYVEAEEWFARLERQLALIPVKQRLIDGRMADFSRLSAARYRYQTEMRGRRSEQVKGYFAAVNEQHAGKSFSDLNHEPGMPLLSPTAEVYFGEESLSKPRKQRIPISLSLRPSVPPQEGAAADEIRRGNLNVLTPQRAANFVEKHLPKKGGRVSTEELRVNVEDDLLDLLAAMAFDRGPVGSSTRTVKWRVISERGGFCSNPENVQRDAEADRLLERITFERIS